MKGMEILLSFSSDFCAVFWYTNGRELHQGENHKNGHY